DRDGVTVWIDTDPRGHQGVRIPADTDPHYPAQIAAITTTLATITNPAENIWHKVRAPDQSHRLSDEILRSVQPAQITTYMEKTAWYRISDRPSETVPTPPAGATAWRNPYAGDAVVVIPAGAGTRDATFVRCIWSALDTLG